MMVILVDLLEVLQFFVHVLLCLLIPLQLLLKLPEALGIRCARLPDLPWLRLALLGIRPVHPEQPRKPEQ